MVKPLQLLHKYVARAIGKLQNDSPLFVRFGKYQNLSNNTHTYDQTTCTNLHDIYLACAAKAGQLRRKRVSVAYHSSCRDAELPRSISASQLDSS